MPADRQLSVPTMMTYGIGNIAEGIKSTAYGTFLLFFYQQVLGLSGSLAGLALAISILVDAITDPLVGQLSDRFKSRWGRRHPLILASALPLGVSFFLLFNPPAGISELQLFIWLTVTAVMARVCLTFFDIPYLALGAEMAHDYNQRTTLFTIATLFRVASGAIITYLAFELFFPTSETWSPGILNPDGYFKLGVFSGLGMIIAMLVCTIGTWKEIPFLRQSHAPAAAGLSGFLLEFADLFRSPSFRAVFIGLIFYMVVVNVERGISTFAAVHFWGLSTETLGRMSIASLAGALLAFPLVRTLTQLMDKKFVLILMMIIFMLNSSLFVSGRLIFPELFPRNGSTVIVWLIAINYFVVGSIGLIVISTLNSMYADIADEYESITDKRREGTLFATRSFASKAAAAGGTMLGGIALDLIQFPKGAAYGTVAPDTVWQLGFIYGPASSIFVLITIFFFAQYRLTRVQHARTLAEIRRRRANPPIVSEQI